MGKYAVIDIGSNSVRLMTLADGKVLYKTLETTRLGEGIAVRPVLQKQAIARTASAVCAFYERARSEGAEEVFAFATAAVRSAENREEFLSAVEALCSLRVEVVSGDEEARLGILGALGAQDGSIVDVGGASTEITVQKDGKIVYAKSVNVGVVRLKDGCGRGRTALESACRQAVGEFGNVPFVPPVYAIGGTATTLGAVKTKMREYDGVRLTGTRVTAAEMRTLADRLCTMDEEEIRRLDGMHPKRADVIGGGAVLLAELMETLKLPEILISDSDNLEGYARKKGLL